MDICFHCGEKNKKIIIYFNNKSFCCIGCKSVYEILHFNKLHQYYNLNKIPGIRPDIIQNNQFDYLDSSKIFKKIVDFCEKNITLVTFKIPVIHCSSCIWILESLKKINKSIISSYVNFNQKTVQISFNHQELKLSELVILLNRIGYKPIIGFNKKNHNIDNDTLLIKLSIAGFSFGNSMLFSLPDYLAEVNDIWMNSYRYFFAYLMFLISIPVVLYSANDYYKSAINGIKNRFISIDVPISIGIIVLFVRSIYEIYNKISSGYFDTLSGLVFFMLIGKFFQQKTYKFLYFDHDYRSFYPISVTKISKNQIKENILISELKIGDYILIRNQEIIPADVILIEGKAKIDNSFITGESFLVDKKKGDLIFAGGKQIGTIIKCKITKEVNKSYLTQLWDHSTFKKNISIFFNITTKISSYFSIIILLITFLSGFYWYFILNSDLKIIFQIISSILIIACPCALALSAPFTIGHIMRFLSKKKIYIKNSNIIEKIAKINHIVFDKTGTISFSNKIKIKFEGEILKEEEKFKIFLLVQNSNHPLSKSIASFLGFNKYLNKIKNFEEIPGKGISGYFNNQYYKIGSSSWVLNKSDNLSKETEVYVSINNKIKGKFIFYHRYRDELKNVILKLKSYKISLISGDNSTEKKKLYNIFNNSSNLFFNQSPKDKLLYIKKLQKKGDIVLMIGDGLNDAGALKQSNVGIAISENINSCLPASDIILSGKSFYLLPELLILSQQSINIIWISFIISALYNIVGIFNAITGNINPLFAAILMPISSITIVVFTSFTTWYISQKYLK